MRVFLLFIFFSFSILSSAQKFYKSGELPLYNIEPKEYPGQNPQNHFILQGHDGIIFIANSYGVLTFDGIHMKRVKGTERKVLNFIKDDEGEIYVGGDGELGYISHDSIGNHIYISFLNKIPEALRQIGRVLKTKKVGDKIAFICEKNVFLFKDKELFKVVSFDDYHDTFYHDGFVFLISKQKGLLELNEYGELIEVSNSKIWTNYKNYFSNAGKIIGIGDEDIITFYLEGEKVKNETVRPLHKKMLGVRVHNVLPYGNYYFIASEIHGILIFNTEWKLVKEINTKNSDLQSNYVRSLYIDNENNLWASLDAGISVIDIASFYTYYGTNSGINGNINDLSIKDNKVTIVGSQGILQLNRKIDQSFQDLELIKGECWAIEDVELSGKKITLIATNNTIDILENSKLTKVIDALPYDIHQSENNNNRIWIGNDNGFITLYWNGKKLQEEHRKVLNNPIINVCTDGNGSIWMGSNTGGIYFFEESKMADSEIEDPIFFDSLSGLPGDSRFTYPFKVNDRVLFATTKGIYEFDKEEYKFAKTKLIGEKSRINDRYIFRFKDIGDKVWIVTRILEDDRWENGIFDLNNKTWSFKAYKDLNHAVQYQEFFDESMGNLWVAGSEGIFRIKEFGQREFKPYSASISLVKYDPDSILFGGNYFPDFSNNIYNYSKRPLRFQFAANSYFRKGGIKFKYILEGFDDNWTDWSSESEAVYTNLPDGDYNFRVKAIDYFENESEEASFAFKVLPPWYLTPWAYTLYFFGFVGFVFGAIKVSTISLQRIIKENTKEIVAQKEEIEKKNDVLEDQKGKIEKQNLNILDSIRYAKRIQLATLPSNDKMKSFLDNSFVMYKPKDIVSGDFYWLENFKDDQNERILFSAVDCTGHGVPGAFMSIIGFNGLNRVVREYKLYKPAEIMDQLNLIITNTLNQQGTSGEEIKDGMDMSLCSLDVSNKILDFAGANNPLYIIRKTDDLIVNEEKKEASLKEGDQYLFEIKPDKQPIGAFEGRKNFTNHTVKLKKDDMVLLFTDGFADQFGGPKGKKFFYKPFKRMLMNVADQPVNEQHKVVESTFYEWISHKDRNGEPTEQVDDICVLGVRI